MGKTVILAWWVRDCEGYDVEVNSTDRSLVGAAACYDAKSGFLCLVVTETTLPPTEVGGLALADLSSQNHPLLKSQFQCFVCSSNKGPLTALFCILTCAYSMLHYSTHITFNLFFFCRHFYFTTNCTSLSVRVEPRNYLSRVLRMHTLC